MFYLCVALAALFATSFYLNHANGNMLRQLCYDSLESLSEGARPGPALAQIGRPRWQRQRGVCAYQGTRSERGFMIKTYALGYYDLEYELDKWSLFRADIERLRGAYITAEGSDKQLRMRISLGPKKGSLVPDFVEERHKQPGKK